MGGTCSAIALVGPGHKVLRHATAFTPWTRWQVVEMGSIDYEIDIIMSGVQRKALRSLFRAYVAAEDFLLRPSGLISVSFALLC